MPPHSIGSGTISFGLVSIPVKLYTASSSGGVSFNLLHAKCGNRIRQQQVCPLCNEVVDRAGLVKGYEFAKDQYVRLADAHVNLGRLYHEAKEPAKAEAHYRAAIEHAPGDPIAHFNLGVLLEDRKRSDEAIRAYRQAIARAPDFADAHYNLGLLFETLGKRSEAIHHLRLARKLYTRSGSAR